MLGATSTGSTELNLPPDGLTEHSLSILGPRPVNHADEFGRDTKIATTGLVALSIRGTILHRLPSGEGHPPNPRILGGDDESPYFSHPSSCGVR